MPGGILLWYLAGVRRHGAACHTAEDSGDPMTTVTIRARHGRHE
jgi:hypothetical protein